MKEDYLWDKTGNDPAIEKLEETLRVFRVDESPRQVPTREIEPVENPSFFKLFSFGFAAAAACIAIAMIAWTVSSRYSSVDTPSVPDQGQQTASAPTIPLPVEPALAHPGGPTVIAVRPASPGRQKGRNKRALRLIAAKTNRRKPATEGLTQEEIYAYNRLVLALSIAGDKLNLVREKIKGE